MPFICGRARGPLASEASAARADRERSHARAHFCKECPYYQQPNFHHSDIDRHATGSQRGWHRVYIHVKRLLAARSWVCVCVSEYMRLNGYIVCDCARADNGRVLRVDSSRGPGQGFLFLRIRTQKKDVIFLGVCVFVCVCCVGVHTMHDVGGGKTNKRININI